MAPVTPLPEPWMTKRELARELRVSARTVTRLRLPHVRVGGQNRYRRSEVEAALTAAPAWQQLPLLSQRSARGLTS
jgi:excisionase family DNA binding protein